MTENVRRRKSAGGSRPDRLPGHDSRQLKSAYLPIHGQLFGVTPKIADLQDVPEVDPFARLYWFVSQIFPVFVAAGSGLAPE